jgi:hypothetical protein
MERKLLEFITFQRRKLRDHLPLEKGDKRGILSEDNELPAYGNRLLRSNSLIKQGNGKK